MKLQFPLRRNRAHALWLLGALAITPVAWSTGPAAAPAAGPAAGPATPGPGPSGPCPKSGARVAISATGSITLNGQATPVENLAAGLTGLAPRPTEVCYFRQKGPGEPPASVKQAIAAIIAAHLPISFYSDGSFTKRIEMPGR